VSLCCHQSDAIKNSGIDFILVLQSPETVAFRLDLEPVNNAVYRGQINTNLTLAQSQFFNDYRVRVRTLSAKALAQGNPNLCIVQPSPL